MGDLEAWEVIECCDDALAAGTHRKVPTRYACEECIASALRAVREETLEEAAKEADECDKTHGSRHAGHYDAARCVAAALRAKKEVR